MKCMRSITPAVRSATLIAACTLALASASAAFARDHDDRGNDSFALRNQGYFFVGGEYYQASDGQFMKNQMYVEFQIPRHLRHPYPIVLIHGGGLTGTYMMGTPDGREGWNTFFLRQGYAVYVP